MIAALWSDNLGAAGIVAILAARLTSRIILEDY
jgi:hypothetical protein